VNLHEVSTTFCWMWRLSTLMSIRRASRDSETTFGARSYSAGQNSVGYALRNYANNIYEYNKILEELNINRR
jgi:hypothetical protein